MRPELSLYLDLLRIGAAFTVFLGHLSWEKLSGGALWQIQIFAHDGVIVFFVLSGFVIQHVVAQKERGLQDYAVARLARLYSVVLPALLLTVVCDSLGKAINADVYVLEGQTEPVLRILASAVFLSQSWGWNLSTLSNYAFWSLPYEFWYYVIFGAFVFLRGKQRMVCVAAGCLMAGPAILVYFPIWLFGAAAYRASQRYRLSELQAKLLFAVSSIVILGVLALEARGMIARSNLGYLPPAFSVVDFLTGAVIALNLFAASFMAIPLQQAGRHITFVAGFSFALYLFHLPLLHLGAAIVPGDWPVFVRGTILALLTLSLVYLLGLLSERRKQGYTNIFSRILSQPVGR
jgi:peptidoglycan/LPS O-acetylase OafA/YrhL